MTTLRDWLADREKRDRQLYQRYGRPLEREHIGEYVAIGPEGSTVLGKDDVAVLRQAIERFESGNFALFRVGHRTYGQWLNFNQ